MKQKSEIRNSQRLIAVVVGLLLLHGSVAVCASEQPKVETEHIRNGDIYKVTLCDTLLYPFKHADYAVFIPEGVKAIRGVLVHQHGCGMEQFGVTIPYDIQYQAFAKKWNLAVIEPVLYGDCHIWGEVSRSGPALLEALDKIGNTASHAELKSAPWLLWGHSGGGFWTLSMMHAYPERILAAFCYSPAWGETLGEFPAAATKIPLFIRHAGSGEVMNNNDCCWSSSLQVFNTLKKADALVGIARTPGQNHNFSYVRYMAIPFYEAVLKQRLPDKASSGIRDMDRTKAWLGDTATFRIYPAATYTGAMESMCWLPDSIVAVKWKEYVATGNVTDQTPPPPPYDLQIRKVNDSVELTWRADADIESGIKHFNIYRDGVHIAQFPESGAYQRFDTNGDNAIPVKLPEMKVRIAVSDKKKTVFSIRTVNHFDWESEETKIVFK